MPRPLEQLRPALAGLTVRGRSFLASGAAAALCALVLGQKDLLRVALLLIALPLCCALMLTRARYRLSLTRTISPARVTVGTPARVRLEVVNLTRLGTRTLLAEDRLPYSLGAPPRFVLDRLPGGRRAAVTYTVQSETRGRYPVGPLRLRLTDPFGMCELARSFTATDPLVVIPPIWPLTSLRAGGLWAGTGESVSRSAAASGEDDVAVREYRDGDDLRRVHWRSTARRGKLMVRRDEQPRQMRATVLLDCRTDGHRGDGPGSSFEWAVSAAASAAVHLSEQRYGVRVLTDASAHTWTGPSSGESGHLLDQLAVVRTGPSGDLAAAVRTISRTGGDGLLVAVLGEIGEDEAAALARVSRSGSPGVAILLRTTGWADLPAGTASTLDERRRRAGRVLHGAGWLVADAGPGQSVTNVWAAATGRNPADSLPVLGFAGAGR